jgi:protein-L-isoaspartate(D-aspartate) O-methyltransferase
MQAWILPPPKDPVKSREEFRKERRNKVKWLIRNRYLRSKRIKDALLKVPREDFVPVPYKDYAYMEVPFPLPGERATISCPHSYPLFYEPLGLGKGHKFLEVGLGSGYGAAVAREVIGQEGLVVSIEIDPITFDFAKENLENAGYKDIVLVNGDGGLGHPEMSPYDRISVTAACADVPLPLIEQLGIGGRFIAPIIDGEVQHLILLKKSKEGIRRKVIGKVLYLPLRGKYGVSG